MTSKELFKDGKKVDSSKKHLVVRPAYARIDNGRREIHIWDQGPNYDSFPEMINERKEIGYEEMFNDLNTKPGRKFANRGLCITKVLNYKGNNFLVVTSKRNSNILGLLTGYYSNGIDAPLEREDVPENINVPDQILRTAAIEELEEFNIVSNGKVQRGEVRVTKRSTPVSFAPLENSGFPYTPEAAYKVDPFDGRLTCLTNLHPFTVSKVDGAKDKSPVSLGSNVGVYFDRFHNCYQVTVSLQTSVDNIEFLFQTEDKYRDKEGMDTFLYRDGIKLIKLDDEGNLTKEVCQITNKGKLQSVSLERLLVSDTLAPSELGTGMVIAETMPLRDLVEMQGKS